MTLELVIGSWFNLPRLGTDVFASLMKARVRYEKGKGFMFGPETDVRAASRTIERATGEAVGLSVRCVLCGVECCPSCTYRAVCDRTVVSPACLCGEHVTGSDAFGAYVKMFESRLSE
jgi:hypothetical protein